MYTNYIQNGCKSRVEHVRHVLHVDTDSLWVGTYLRITYVRYFFSSKHCVVFKLLSEETLTNRKNLVGYVFFKNNVKFFVCVYMCEIFFFLNSISRKCLCFPQRPYYTKNTPGTGINNSSFY